MGNGTLITLLQDAVFQPACSGQPKPHPVTLEQLESDTSILGAREPFYASTSPQIYAIAAATIVSYMLVIILFITPRTFVVGGAGGGFLGQRNMITGASGTSAVIGIGSRPWLQKVAALTVAISLTIATADTFRVAEEQYEAGYQDAVALTDSVGEGLEIRITRVISDTCLWLAQVQTLIRLFTRHKEKVIIKWIGFGLIVLDTTFSILNYFVANNGKTRPRKFVDAIPALNYLFALSLSLLYAAWVIYYSLSKRRYAFFHRKMRNIFLLAILALTAVLIPVVFFVLDISQPNVNGWGNYVRWVGAAAASVVVWEWVERIEALERDEKKDGILGREIFAGDEMLQVTPSTEINGSGQRRNNRRAGGRCGQGDGNGTSTGWNGITNRFVGARVPPHRSQTRGERTKNRTSKGRELPKNDGTKQYSTNDSLAALPTVTSPVSREDTTSAASTVYVIHYHDNEDPMPASRPPRLNPGETFAHLEQGSVPSDQAGSSVEHSSRRKALLSGWQRVTNPFKRGRSSPPQEVIQAQGDARDTRGSVDPRAKHIINISSQPASFFDRLKPNRTSSVDLASLPQIIIPAPRLGIDILMEAEASRTLQLQPSDHVSPEI